MEKADLISRAAAIEAVYYKPSHKMAIEVLKEVPAVDAAPVVHGRWEDVEDIWGDTHYRCSVCNCEWFLEDGTPTENGMNYCPKCGAKMDGERRESE